MKILRFMRCATLGLALPFALSGCAQAPAVQNAPQPAVVQRSAKPADASVPISSAALTAVDLNDPLAPSPLPSVSASAAGNEWVSFVLQVSSTAGGSLDPAHLALDLHELSSQSGSSLRCDVTCAYHILPVLVDTNRAGFIRHNGASAGVRNVPRVLFPLALQNDSISLQPLASHSGATFAVGAAQGFLLWVDLHIPKNAIAGHYAGSCTLRTDTSPTALATVPLALNVYAFSLPDQRHLQMVTRLDWDDLHQKFPIPTEAITTRLINRTDPTYAPVVKCLDAMVGQAHDHRLALVIPQLQPTVKWSAGEEPGIDWDDFDSLIGPWMGGQAFGDKVAMDCWPIPEVDYLGNYDPASQTEYYRQAAVHFDQQNWLSRASAFLALPPTNASMLQQQLELSTSAQRVLSAHPLLRAVVPLRDDQLIFTGQEPSAGSSTLGRLLDPNNASRLVSAGPGLIYSPATRPWTIPDRPQHWLRADLPGLVPTVGAGADERDVRLWAWLAFVRNANVVLWNGALPAQTDATTAADPNALAWFYPGLSFGFDGPLESIQLKWLRRAEQDYEYLWTVRQEGSTVDALVTSRLITKPVKVSPNESSDPSYTLLSGTTDPAIWNQALALLARTILLHTPGKPLDELAYRNLNIDLQEWLAPKERPYLIPRSIDWQSDPQRTGRLIATLGVDLYNACDRLVDGSADGSQYALVGAPAGWQFSPQPNESPKVDAYAISHVSLDATFNLENLTRYQTTPLTLSYLDGFTRRKILTSAVVPIAPSDRREGHLAIDGKLDDWSDADLIHNGPLVVAMDRPQLQEQSLQFTRSPARLYTAWGDDSFYVAFQLSGVASGSTTSTNFTDFQYRRAWGADVCEILIQSIGVDGQLGPVLSVACKPNAPWVSRKEVGKDTFEPWDAYPARYAGNVDSAGTWRGEVAIPWAAILKPGQPLPAMLRFNVTQHQQQSGQTSSWAGPVDFGNDDRYMGLLVLRENRTPGVAGRDPR